MIYLHILHFLHNKPGTRLDKYLKCGDALHNSLSTPHLEKNRSILFIVEGAALMRRHQPRSQNDSRQGFESQCGGSGGCGCKLQIIF